MAEAEPAYLDMEMYGYVDDGEEVYHEVVLWDDVEYEITLESEDEKADLDIYITDEEDEVLYEDEDEDPGAGVYFTPDYHGVHYIFVKSASGATDYTLTIAEREEEEEEEETTEEEKS